MKEHSKLSILALVTAVAVSILIIVGQIKAMPSTLSYEIPSVPKNAVAIEKIVASLLKEGLVIKEGTMIKGYAPYVMAIQALAENECTEQEIFPWEDAPFDLRACTAKSGGYGFRIEMDYQPIYNAHFAPYAITADESASHPEVIGYMSVNNEKTPVFRDVEKRILREDMARIVTLFLQKGVLSKSLIMDRNSILFHKMDEKHFYYGEIAAQLLKPLED